MRFRLREMPLERDEGEYAYGGQLLLQGISPWHLFYTVKFPGTSGVYAVLMTLFGQSCAGVHLGLLVVNAAAIVLVFILARQLVGSTASWVAAATYALMSLSGDALGMAGHATHFVVLPALAGLILLWRASGAGRPAVYFGSGLLLGLSLLMKQNGVFFVACGAIWLAWVGGSKRLLATAPFLKNYSAFLVGIAAPFLIMVLLLWQSGVLEKFWFWTFDYARVYGLQNPGLEQIRRRIMQRMPPVEQPAFYFAFIGLAALWSKRDRWSAALFTTVLLFCSLLAVLPGLHFRSHYFVLLMPVLALLTGAAVQQVAQFFGGGRLRFLAIAPIFAFAFFFAKGVARERALFFQLSPVEACRSLYGFDPFPESITVADYIRTHSPPNARIAVLGSEPEIYFYAHRRAATGYIYAYPLLERQPFARQMRQEMLQEIAAARPLFLVQVRTWTSWLSRPGTPTVNANTCDALTPPHYELVGSADFIAEESRFKWRWGVDASNRPTNASFNLLIFQLQPPAANLY